MSTVFIEWVCKSAHIAHTQGERDCRLIFRLLFTPDRVQRQRQQQQQRLAYQAITHAGTFTLGPSFLSLVNITLSISLCFMYGLCLMLARLLLYAQRIQALRSSRVE